MATSMEWVEFEGPLRLPIMKNILHGLTCGIVAQVPSMGPMHEGLDVLPL